MRIPRLVGFAASPFGGGARGGRTRVEETVALEAGDECGFRADHAAVGRAVDDHFFRKPVEHVERGGTSVRETRQVDRLRREIEERGTETEIAVLLAAPAR